MTNEERLRADLVEARETIENLGRQVGGLPLLRVVIEERDALAAECAMLREALEKARARFLNIGCCRGDFSDGMIRHTPGCVALDIKEALATPSRATEWMVEHDAKVRREALEEAAKMAEACADETTEAQLECKTAQRWVARRIRDRALDLANVRPAAPGGN